MACRAGSWAAVLEDVPPSGRGLWVAAGWSRQGCEARRRLLAVLAMRCGIWQGALRRL